MSFSHIHFSLNSLLRTLAVHSSSIKVAKTRRSLSQSFFFSLSAMLAFAYVTGVARAVDTARVKKKGRGNCRRRYTVRLLAGLMPSAFGK